MAAKGGVLPTAHAGRKDYSEFKGSGYRAHLVAMLIRFHRTLGCVARGANAFWPLLKGGFMLQPAIEIMDTHRIMAISTSRLDGWPQTTIVGYVNDGWTVYFLILRNSQKFANIQRDDRISFAIGAEAIELEDHKAVYAGARASEVTDEEERERCWRLLVERHPNLAGFDLPDPSVTALMRAVCKHVSVLDYSLGLGHTEALTVQDDGSVISEERRMELWQSLDS